MRATTFFIVPLVALAWLVALTACTADATPTVLPTPTPATSPYWPAYPDFLMAMRLSGHPWSFSTRYYPALASIYVARECFAGNPLTPGGFRTFVDQTDEKARGMNQTDAYALVAAQARDVASRLAALQGKDVRGSCIEPFLYPKTGGEAQLGQALFEVAVTEHLRRTSGSLGAYYAIQRGAAALPVAHWFQLEANSRDPFVPWLWANPVFDIALEPLAQIPSGVPMPKGDVRLPIAWAMEYQLSLMQVRDDQQASDIRALCEQVKNLATRYTPPCL